MFPVTHSSSTSSFCSRLPRSQGEAVFARCLSSLKEERVEASRSLSGPQGVKYSGDKASFLEDIRKVDATVLTVHVFKSILIDLKSGFYICRDRCFFFSCC